MPHERGINLEIKLLGIRHMSRPKLFNLGLPNSVSNLELLNVCGLHMRDGKRRSEKFHPTFKNRS